MLLKYNILIYNFYYQYILQVDILKYFKTVHVSNKKK